MIQGGDFVNVSTILAGQRLTGSVFVVIAAAITFATGGFKNNSSV